MKINYDSQIDALYLYFKKAKIAKTMKLANKLFVDVDARGSIIGMEILDATTQFGKRKIAEYENGMDARTLDTLLHKEKYSKRSSWKSLKAV